MRVRDLLASYEPLLAAHLSDSFLAAWLIGAGAAIEGLPAAELDPFSLLFDIAPPPSIIPTPTPDDTGAIVRFPLAESAVRDLAERRVVTRDEYENLAQSAKQEAFSIARIANVQALGQIHERLIRDLVDGGNLREFRQSADTILEGTPLHPAHLETVYRTNIATAYTQGLIDTLNHSLVDDEFPYLEYNATHDSRTRPEHLRLESLGLNGTGIYRRDDPLWRSFLPPWDFNCRCAVVPLSVEDAAAKGVQEAQQWLANGRPPAYPAHVLPPPFSPPAGWAGPKFGG